MTSPEKMVSDQAKRFDLESEDYDRAHSHPSALAYRNEFFRNRLCGFDLQGRTVLDAMCASGIDTPFLIERGAKVVGLDISENCAAIFRERFSAECVVSSIHDTPFNEQSFDVIYVSGGFHHVAPILSASFGEVHRILKTGGRLCFIEPNADNWTDGLRRWWYARDEKFGSEERALHYHKELRPLLKLGFEEEDYFTGGNIAYLLFQQGNVLNTPKFVLNTMKGPLFLAERVINSLPFAPRFFLCARWRKVR